MQVYLNFWKSNLFYEDIPNIEKITQILTKKGEKMQILFNFMQNFEKFTEKQFYYKTKSIQQSCIIYCKNTISKLDKICKKLMYLYSNEESKILNANEIFSNLIFHSIQSKNLQLNAILRLGYLNVIV